MLSVKAFFRRSSLLITLMLLAGVAFIVYSNIFDAPFVFDDYHNIKDNPYVRMTEISPESVAEIAKCPSEQRPLANLTFALNYYFNRYDVTGYHVVNVVIHILTAFLAFLIFRQTLYLCGHKNDLLAAVAALLWLVNPVHTQSVTYIVQRMTSMCTMFYLLSLCSYIKARIEWQLTGNLGKKSVALFTVSIISFAAALVSKQIAATLPVFVFLYEWFFFRSLDENWVKKNLKWIGLAFVIIAGSGLYYMDFAPIERILTGYESRDFSLLERLLTEPRIILLYISILFLPLPSRLNLEYDINISTNLFEPFTTFWAILAIFFLLFFAVLSARRCRILSFAILWFLGNLVIESSIIPLELVFEHRTYLPSVFLFFAVTYYLFQIAGNHIKIAVAFFLCLIVFSAGLTLARNHTWADLHGFNKDCYQKSPEKPRVVLNLGFAYQEREQYKRAAKYYNRVIALDPHYAKAYGKLGLVNMKLDKPKTGIKYLERAAELNPGDYESRNNLGVAYTKLGKTDKAITQFRKALKANPAYISARINLAKAYGEKKQYKQSLTEFSKVLELDPENFKAHNNMAAVLMEMGKKHKAAKHFSLAAAYNPKSKAVQFNLARAYLDEDKYEKAEEHLLAALKLDPKAYKKLKKTGDLYFEQKKYAKAQKYYKKAADLHPGESYPHFQLGVITLRDNNYRDAKQYFKKAADKGTGEYVANYYLGLCELGRDNLEKGMENLEKSVAANPDFFKAKVKLADTYLAREKPEKALELYNGVLAENAKELHCLKKAAHIHKEKGQHKQALEKFERAYQLDPEDQSVIQNLAFLYARFEKYGKAAEKFAEMTRFMEDNPVLYYNLACMQAEAGDTSRALESLEQAIEYGYDTRSKLMRDENLESIRDTEAFRNLLQGIGAD